MNFNAPLPLREQAKYHEGSKLASPRDSRNVSSSWRKAQSTSKQQQDISQVLQKMSAQMSKMRRKPLGGYAPTPNPQMLPFKVYNINNVSATDAQRLIYTNAGQSIDDFTFQIREGMVGGRNFFVPEAFNIEDSYSGNYENMFFVCGTDNPPAPQYPGWSGFDYPPVANNSVGSVEIPNDVDVYVSGLETFYQPSQIIINSQLTSANSQSLAALWIKMVDSTEGPFIYPEIWGRMWDYTGELGRKTYPFPIDENTIPLAIFGRSLCYPDFGQQYTFCQNWQSGNLINRYTPNCSTYRGIWSVLNNQITSEQGLIMYEGDIVYDDTVSFTGNVTGGGTFNYKKTYVYTNGVGSETVGPNANPGNWQVIATTIV